MHVQLGDQRAHGVVIINGSDDRTLFDQRIAFEIHLSDQALRPGFTREREMNMRRTPVAGLVTPRVGAGLDSAKTVIAVFIGQHPAAAAEVRVNRGQILIFFMSVAAAGIGLPDFHQGVFHRSAKTIAHVTVHNDPLANRQAFFGVIKDKIVIQRAQIVTAKDRPGDL